MIIHKSHTAAQSSLPPSPSDRAQKEGKLRQHIGRSLFIGILLHTQLQKAEKTRAQSGVPPAQSMWNPWEGALRWGGLGEGGWE